MMSNQNKKIVFICADGTYRSQIFKEIAKERGYESEAFGLSEFADFHGLFPYYEKLKQFNPDLIVLVFHPDEVSAYYEIGERREIIKILKQRASSGGSLKIDDKEVPVREIRVPEVINEERLRSLAKEVVDYIEKQASFDKISNKELDEILNKYMLEDLVV